MSKELLNTKCLDCGSYDIRGGAEVFWSIMKQKWIADMDELASVCCHDCGSESFTFTTEREED